LRSFLLTEHHLFSVLGEFFDMVLEVGTKTCLGKP